jgi:phage-related holin
MAEEKVKRDSLIQQTGLPDSLAWMADTAAWSTGKGAAVGFVVVAGVIWEGLASVLFAVVVLLSACDIIVGVLRAFLEEEPFSFSKFMGGVSKLLAATLVTAVASAMDLLVADYLPGTMPLTGVVLGYVAFGFLGSILTNLDPFFPGLGEMVRTRFRRAE